MLDIVKYKLLNVITDKNDINLIKTDLKNIVTEIETYKKENEPLSDMHSVFRTLEEYSNMYIIETQKFMAIPPEEYGKRAFQSQEILCILSLVLSLITQILRKYANPSEDKGTLSRYLRMLNDNKEHFKGEKMSWSIIAKEQTALIQDAISWRNQPKEVDGTLKSC